MTPKLKIFTYQKEQEKWQPANDEKTNDKSDCERGFVLPSKVAQQRQVKVQLALTSQIG